MPVMEEAPLEHLAAKFGSDSEAEEAVPLIDAPKETPPAPAPTADAQAGSPGSSASDSDAYYDDDDDYDSEDDEELATALDWADMSEGQGGLNLWMAVACRTQLSHCEEVDSLYLFACGKDGHHSCLAAWLASLQPPARTESPCAQLGWSGSQAAQAHSRECLAGHCP
jgi:hypothetical protein